MGRTVAIGVQDFEKIIKNKYLYIDKTDFIKEWWESGDDVTLITRPRRFGKTLTMSMLDYFFSVKMQIREVYLTICLFGGKKSIGNCREHILSLVYPLPISRRMILNPQKRKSVRSLQMCMCRMIF